ncbi:hypothetical protein LIA77_09102 [Sarocladium implicatum]|nr:hypothetical protein LIA77_09102 [Sarocladium implicatum]
MAPSRPVANDTLYFKGSATEAFAQLTATKTNVDLLNATHNLHCGPNCNKDISCEFLHYSRPSESVPKKETSLSVYNTRTSGLFTFMGEAGQYIDVVQQHEVNLWPLLESVLDLVDKASTGDQASHFDYSDWAQKHDANVESILLSSCRDSLQWFACWPGKDYDISHTTLHYTAFATVPDDLCIPPLDLVNGKFRMFKRSAYDMIHQMEAEGWGSDATAVLLSLVLEYLMQYAEKIELEQKDNPRARLHQAISRSSTIWDSTVYRARTGNADGVLVCMGRALGTGALPLSWLFEAGICCCIGMDIGKVSAGIYKHDVHRPTKTTVANELNDTQKEIEMSRRSSYHSLYLDLMDRLLANDAPQHLLQVGCSGLLFIYKVDRYRERQAARRIPRSRQVDEDIVRIWGRTAADPWIESLFQPKNFSSCPDS